MIRILVEDLKNKMTSEVYIIYFKDGIPIEVWTHPNQNQLINNKEDKQFELIFIDDGEE